MSHGDIVNYPRLVKSALLIYVLEVMFSTLLTVSFGENFEAELRTFLILNYTFGFLVSLFVYAFIGFKQIEKPYIHSILIALCLWFIALSVSFSINLSFGIPINSLIYLIPFVLTVFEISLGTTVGIKIREKKVTNAI